MKFKKTLGIAACILATLVGCAKKPLTPAAPWTDIVDDSLYFLATTTDPSGTGLEYTFDWGDGQTSTTRRYHSGETAYIRHSFDDPGWRDIRVQARNENGKASGWSAPLRFRNSNPPVIADDTISGLVRWAVNRWYHASVTVTDPDGDSVSVKFIWDNDPGAIWSQFVPSGSVITDSFIWTTGGQHSVGLVARDKGNMVARPESTKTVSVSRMAVVWDTYETDLYCDGTPTLGSIDGEPVLYCVGADCFCYTLDGQLRWSTPMDGGMYAASLSADGTRLYLNDYMSGLVCLDSRTGRQMWSLVSGGGNYTPALGPGGAIYAVAGPSWICELSRIRDCGDSASVEWTLPLGDCGPIDNGMIVGRDGTVYAVGYDALAECSFLVAVDSAGNVQWKDSARIKVGGTPVIDSRDRIIVADQSGGLYCFNKDGSLDWSASSDPLWPNCIAVGWDDNVIVIGDDERIRCFDSQGRQRWISDARIGAYSNTPCVVQDSTIIAIEPYGHTCCIDNDGQTRWEFSVFDSLGYGKRRAKRLDGEDYTSPLIGPDGNLYLALSGTLVCVTHGGLKMANTAWPTYNHDNAHSGWAGRQ